MVPGENSENYSHEDSLQIDQTTKKKERKTFVFEVLERERG
ncbi:hypothetical protein [Hydrogenimonas cancrithermarum]|nr:hypothetical protein [Hydrogenimonas cancrithermarum]